MCVDASYVPIGTPAGFGSLNQGIPKGEYMGIPFKYNLPRVREFVEDAVKIGLDCVKGFKVDWSHAYRQNSLDPAEWWLTLLHIGNDLTVGYYLDIRSNFGIRSSGIYNQLVSESIPFMLAKIQLDTTDEISRQQWTLRSFLMMKLYIYPRYCLTSFPSYTKPT